MNAVILATNAYKAAQNVAKPKNESGRHAWRDTQANTGCKERFPILDTILLTIRDGYLVMATHDLKEALTDKCPARVNEDFATCVPARAFVDWLRVTQNPKKGQPDQIELTLEQNILTIKAGNTRAQFKCMDADNFPPC